MTPRTSGPLAQALPPLQKARVLAIPVRWRISGSEQAWVTALIDAATVPNDRDDDGFMLVNSGGGFPGNAGPVTIEPGPWIRAVGNAKNRSIHIWLLRNAPKLSEDLQRALVAMLDDFDLELQDLTLQALSHDGSDETTPIVSEAGGDRNKALAREEQGVLETALRRVTATRPRWAG